MAMDLGAHEFEDFRNIDIFSLLETVLPWRTARYRDDLRLKLSENEGIENPKDLIRVRKELLDTKLSTRGFNTIEMADMHSLRSAMDPESAKRRRGRATSGFNRIEMADMHSLRSAVDPESAKRRRGRSRSRSLRRLGGRDSRRNYNLPPNASKNSSWSGNLNTKEKDKPELWKAVALGDAAKVQELLNQGKDPTETFEGWSPLMKASEEDNEEVIRMLLNKKVDIEVTNNKGRTALSFAAAPSNNGSTKRPTAVAAMRLLLQNGADAHKVDDQGKTATIRATNDKRDDALAVLDEYRSTTQSSTAAKQSW